MAAAAYHHNAVHITSEQFSEDHNLLSSLIMVILSDTNSFLLVNTFYKWKRKGNSVVTLLVTCTVNYSLVIFCWSLCYLPYLLKVNLAS